MLVDRSARRRSSGDNRSNGGGNCANLGVERAKVLAWLIDSLDREARRLGVTRQSVIKVWIAERLERKVS